MTALEQFGCDHSLFLYQMILFELEYFNWKLQDNKATGLDGITLLI